MVHDLLLLANSIFSSKNIICRLLGLCSSTYHKLVVTLETIKPSIDVGSGVVDYSILNSSRPAKEGSSHFSNQFLISVGLPAANENGPLCALLI